MPRLFTSKANELLLGEFVIRALRARRHRVSAAEVHFGMTVGAVIRSASRSSSGLVDLVHAFLLDISVCNRHIYYTKIKRPFRNRKSVIIKKTVHPFLSQNAKESRKQLARSKLTCGTR